MASRMQTTPTACAAAPPAAFRGGWCSSRLHSRHRPERDPQPVCEQGRVGSGRVGGGYGRGGGCGDEDRPAAEVRAAQHSLCLRSCAAPLVVLVAAKTRLSRMTEAHRPPSAKEDNRFVRFFVLGDDGHVVAYEGTPTIAGRATALCMIREAARTSQVKSAERDRSFDWFRLGSLGQMRDSYQAGSRVRPALARSIPT